MYQIILVQKLSLYLRSRKFVSGTIGMCNLDGCCARREKSNPIALDTERVVLQLMGLLMVVQMMGLLLRGITLQMMLSRVQHAAAESIQLGQRSRTHL